MGLRIRTNVAAINAQRRLANTTNDVQSSYEKLSSGRRINKAADDSAGLGIASNLSAEIRSLTVAKNNASDGISIIQVAEGGLAESSNMLTRLRELAIQAASDTVGNTERGYIQKEFGQLKDEIDRIASSTEFNGTKLLVGQRDHAPDGMSFESDNAFPLVVQVGKDYFPDVDGADAKNPVNIIKIDLTDLDAFAAGLGIGASDDSDGTRVDSRQSAQESIHRIDGALQKVSEYRSYLGATQNRLGSTIRNLDVSIENMGAAKSRIIDADYALETAKLTQNNILQQAGASVLSQANAMPQIALNLIRGG